MMMFHEQSLRLVPHLQQQVTRCSATLDQKRQVQDQLQLTIEQTHDEIEQIQANVNTEKKVRGKFQDFFSTFNV